MAGFSGRVSFEGNPADAKYVVDKALTFANKLIAWKKTAKVSSVTKVLDLGGGYSAVVTLLDNMQHLHINYPAKFTDTPSFLPSKNGELEPSLLGVIDVVSGRVDSTLIKVEPVGTVNGKPVSVKRIQKFVPSKKSATRYSTDYMRYRMAVEEYPKDPAQETSQFTFSHHAKFFPSKYSGSMAKVVQLLLGIGFIPRQTYEQTWAQQKRKKMLTTTSIGENVKSAFSLFEQDRRTYLQKLNLDDPESPPVVHVLYSCSWSKTHGISFDANSKPWVLEISSRGVHIMPLYLDPVSTTSAGRQRYLELQPELEEFFDEFGGIPVGMSIPAGKMFSSMKRAKEIIELVSEKDMKEFYDKSAYSDEIGWTINKKGTSAHNTCNEYDEKGVGVGYHYCISVKLGADDLPDWTEDTQFIAQRLKLSKFWEVNKARRMDFGEAIIMARTLRDDKYVNVAQVYKEFDAMDSEINASMDATGTLTMVRKGPLYHPAKPKGQPQIKFPVVAPTLIGNLSWDFGLAYGGIRPTKITCNTPMFVAFVDDALEIVYYYYTTNPQTKYAPFNTREECQYIGSWSQGVMAENSVSYVAGNFYSTSIDWRDVFTSNGLYTMNSKGRFVSEADIYTGGAPYTCITAYHVRVFNITTKTTPITNHALRIGVCIPLYTRDCYYMAREWWENTNSITESTAPAEAWTGKVDIYTVFCWGVHYWGCGEPPGEKQEDDIVYQNPNDGTGPKYLDSVSISTRSCIAALSIPNYQTSECYPDDQPAHLDYSCCVVPNTGLQRIVVSSPSGGVIGYARVPNTPPPPQSHKILSNPTSKRKGILKIVGDYTGTIKEKEYSVKNDGTTDEPIPDGQALDGWWWRFSPDDSGGTAFLAMYGSALGLDIVNYMPDILQFPYKTFGNATTVESDMASEHLGVFVGVLT